MISVGLMIRCFFTTAGGFVDSSAAVAFGLLLLGDCALDATDSNVEFFQCLALGLSDVGEAVLFLCPLSQSAVSGSRHAARRPASPWAIGEILV